MGFKDEKEIMYATCKTCKTKWRRRDDERIPSKLIYEKWACKIPSTNIPFPILGGGIKLSPKWYRRVKIKEKQLPVDYLEEPTPKIASKKPNKPRGKQYDETTLVKSHEYSSYAFTLSAGEKVVGRINSDEPVNILFLDEKNFDKFDRDVSFDIEDEKEPAYEVKIDFHASTGGVWFVVVENNNKTSTKVKVQLIQNTSIFF